MASRFERARVDKTRKANLHNRHQYDNTTQYGATSKKKLLDTPTMMAKAWQA